MNTAAMSFARKMALGAGDFGFNLYWQMASLYLLFFYTDVVGLDPAVAGTIYMAALIWDAALDPVIGMVVDRTRTRYGRYRPYMLFGGVPLALIFLSMFVGPSGDSARTVAYAAVMHVTFRTIYAVIAIPYAALFARVTHDARIRADLAGFRMIFATLAAVLVAGLTLPLVKGLATPESPERGWIVLALIFGTIATLLIMLVAWAAKGYDVDEVDEAPRVALPVLLKSLATNRALLIVLGAVMIGSFSGTLFGKNLLYYFKYIVGNEDLAGAAMAMTAVVAALLIPVFAWIARTYGKRAAWMCGAIPGLAGLVLWHLADGGPVGWLFGALALCAVGTASYAVCFWSMLPDTVEYGEWRSGVRAESAVFGLAVLGQKMALGLGAGYLGIALTDIGYVANAAQTPETLEGIKDMMLWLPLAGGILSATLVAFYPLSLKAHAQMVEEIARRKAVAVSA